MSIELEGAGSPSTMLSAWLSITALAYSVWMCFRLALYNTIQYNTC